MVAMNSTIFFYVLTKNLKGYHTEKRELKDLLLHYLHNASQLSK
ncbi:hypothetical protein L1282_000057 [Chryseobacterium sp. HSC-36S06]|nr:hypothetical protein [Chryseobacterium sp. HSC-36S06]